MKRILPLFYALALLLTLGACGAKPAPEPSEALAAPTAAAEVTPEPAPDDAGEAEAPVPAILSPGAAEDSALSRPFQAKDGELWTGAATGEGFTYIGDVLPVGEGYVSNLLFCDAGTLAVVKEYFFSVDPSALILYPADGGEPETLAESLVPSSRIVLAGDELFYLTWEDGGLQRLNMTTGETEPVSDGVNSLLAASGGFLYYEKDGALYRNDSTGAAEARLFAAAGIAAVAAEGDGLCLLLGTADGTAGILEFRKADGTLSARVDLAEPADNILSRDGKIYVPQLSAGVIRVFAMDGAQELDPIALDALGVGCIVHAVTDDALYYETALETGFVLCRIPLAGGPAEVIGQIIM